MQVQLLTIQCHSLVSTPAEDEISKARIAGYLWLWRKQIQFFGTEQEMPICKYKFIAFLCSMRVI